MDKLTITHLLADLKSLESGDPLSIVKLGEPFSSALPADHEGRYTLQGNQDGPMARTSDVSASAWQTPTPSSLEADLTHYRELFAKLRFSYVEQVTKEKFLRAIVGDPPLIVLPAEITELEAANVTAKSQLKEKKALVANQVADLSQQVQGLEDKVAEFKQGEAEEVAEHERNSRSSSCGLNMRLPLNQTLALIEERQRARDDLDKRVARLTSQVTRKRKAAERLATELAPLEAKKNSVTAAAVEAKRRKAAGHGGPEDDLEERGRWWRASEQMLRQVLVLDQQETYYCAITASHQALVQRVFL